MKKFTAILTAAFMVLSLTACSGDNKENSSAPDSGVSSDSTSSAPETTTTPANTTTTPAETTTAPAETTTAPTETTTTPAETTTTPAETTTTPTETTTAPAESTTTPTESTTTPAETTTTEPVESTDPVESVEIKDGAELLNTVFGMFPEDMLFPAMGGDAATGEIVMDMAGAIGLDADTLDNSLGFPAADIAKIDSAASLFHMMNLNTFTAGAYHLADGTDSAALTESIKTNIMSKQWICGSPDKVTIAVIGEYIAAAYGAAELIDTFESCLAAAYPSAAIQTFDITF